MTTADFPPVSLLISYWMIGAFFMASKRFAEYRSISDPEAAGAYRNSFRHYDEQKLLTSMFFYTTSFALFLGIFIIRYHLELILVFPLVAGFVCYYLHITFKQDSAAQSPERLYRERGLMAYLAICVVASSSLDVRARARALRPVQRAALSDLAVVEVLRRPEPRREAPALLLVRVIVLAIYLVI